MQVKGVKLDICSMFLGFDQSKFRELRWC